MTTTTTVTTSTEIARLTDQINFWTEEKRKYQLNLDNGVGHSPSILSLLDKIDAIINKNLMILSELKTNNLSSSLKSIKHYRPSMSVTNLEEDKPLITQNNPASLSDKSKTTKSLIEGCLVS